MIMSSTRTCHSEYGKLESVFIKKVKAAFVNDESINEQWQDLNYLGKPNLEIAIQEYNQFEAIIQMLSVLYQFS